jgi:hypothetical protein
MFACYHDIIIHELEKKLLQNPGRLILLGLSLLIREKILSQRNWITPVPLSLPFLSFHLTSTHFA